MTTTPGDTTPAEAPPDDVEEYISAAEAIHRIRCRHRQHSKPNAEDYKLAMLAVEAAAPVIAARGAAAQRAADIRLIREAAAVAYTESAADALAECADLLAAAPRGHAMTVPDGGTPAARDAIARCLADVEDFPESEHYALADDVLLALRNAGFRIIGRDHPMTVPDGGTPARGRATGLTTAELFALDQACGLIRKAFKHPPYLVGSAGNMNKDDGPAYRDVDVRLILEDDEFDVVCPTRERWAVWCVAITAYLIQRTGLPIDFQIQRMTEASEKHKGTRNPLSGARLFAGAGDATPKEW